MQAKRAGFESGEWIRATFVDGVDTVKACCRNGKCGHGRRSKPASRARIDGVARAHRMAWRRIIQTARPHAIFEDDAEALGVADDVRFVVGQCEAGKRCAIAFLGLGHDGLLAHAYVVWPWAAALLLNSTRDICNPHGQDYAMRELCGRSGLICLAPPRGLEKRGGSTDTKRSQSMGWGLFTQNLRATPSYNGIINFARGRDAAANWTAAAARGFSRCPGTPTTK